MKRPEDASPATILRRDIQRANLVTDSPIQECEGGGSFTTTREVALAQAVDLLSRFPINKALAIRRAMGALEDLQTGGHMPFYSILDLYRRVEENVDQHNSSVETAGKGKLRQPARVVDAMWDPRLGSTILSGNGNISPGNGLERLGSFYTEARMFAPRHGGRELRGPNYFIALPKEIPLSEKLAVMTADVQAALSVISSTDRTQITSPQAYLLYLGVLDNLKIHSLTLFHALTYNERYLKFPTTEKDQKRYEELRMRSTHMVRDGVRMFYQGMLGLPYDGEIDQRQFNRYFRDASSYVERQFATALWGDARQQGEDSLKYPEVNHPLVIGLGAYEATRSYPNIDVIIGVPSGGTELAYCAELMHGLIHDRSVDVLQIPVSHRSYRSDRSLRRHFKQEYRDRLAGANVLIMDDNSSTGATTEYIGQAIRPMVNDMKVHIAEYDGRRLAIPSAQRDYFDASISPTTMGIAAIDSSGNGPVKFSAQYAKKAFEVLRGPGGRIAG